MTDYTKLIKALRCCGNFEDREGCNEECPYFYDKDCPKRIMCDAADALEAAEKRIEEMEKQLPKEGEWIFEDSVCSPRTCSACKQKFYIGRGWNYCPNCGARMRGVNDE